MALTMDRAEREEFVSAPRVAIMSLAEPGRAGLQAPVWYDFAPDVGFWVITHPDSRKGKLLAASRRYALCAQDETPPAYRYASAEGRVVEEREAELERDYRPMGRRYLGRELGDQFVEATWDEGFRLYVMRPERWLTGDYRKDPLLSGG